jgi:digeranylgeranylglycerophospholipid reductase
MNIAIIGAGVAGLSCAHELERHGINPIIFERRNFIGEEYPHVGAVLEIANRPIKDALKYFKNNLGINIKPLNTVNSVIHNSPNKTTVIKGNLGYFLERSRSPADIKVQMYSQLKNTKILFNEQADYVSLSSQFDYVVIANGSNNFTNELGCWKEWVNTYVKGAVISGNFNPNSMTVWMNKAYCKNGYAYLTPFSSKKASLSLAVTNVSDSEIDKYWEVFLYSENLNYVIEEEYKINHVSGYVYPHRIGNIFLTGNAAGMLDPFLGFGVIGSVVSGVMAARSIVNNLDYEKLLHKIVKHNLRLLEFRKAINSISNAGYDFIISSISVPGLKHLLYYTPLNVIKLGSGILKLTSFKKP